MSLSREDHYGGVTYCESTAPKVQLTLSSRIKEFRTDYQGQIAFLPNATVLPIGEGGPIFIIRNISQTASICLKTFTGVTVGKIPTQTTAMCFLKDGSTASGTWIVCKGSLDSGSGWTIGLSGTCDEAGPNTTPRPATTPEIDITTTRRPDISTGTTRPPTTTVFTFFGANPNSQPKVLADLNPWNLPADAEALFDDQELAEGDRVSSLIQSDAIAATADKAINRILGLRFDGSSALSTVGGAVRGVAYLRQKEAATAEQSEIEDRF